MDTSNALSRLSELASSYFNKKIEPELMTPICQGASGRTIARVCADDMSVIAVHWTDERADNGSFVPCAALLRNSGIRVPNILASVDEGSYGMALVEDLGDVNLLSLSGLPWEKRRAFYISAMEQLHLVHQVDVPAHMRLQPSFDEAMYRWEQEYFAEHFLQGLHGLDAEKFLSHPACARLARELAQRPKVLVHRDFQSQNIHIIDDETWLIDFQGMRMGLAEYDLASLVYDPYAGLTQPQRADLLKEWQTVSGKMIDGELLTMCALQRIMQALGAYAKLSKSGNTWYEKYLNPGTDILREISATSLLAEPLSGV